MAPAKPKATLRRGWTTGTCAAAASRAAYQALLTGVFPDPVSILLPNGARPSFALATTRLSDDAAQAGIVKDAGDDPDVTHGALILATIRRGPPNTGIHFKAGPGVGTITRPGLPLPPGEPAINPIPRAMIRAALEEVAADHDTTPDVTVEISIPNGEKIAERTLNGRLGIVGGLSILGTTGIVIPYSCSAWIASIHRAIDVARAANLPHIAASTGTTSEAAIAKLYNLPDVALIEMGDFVGGVLKYVRRHPVPRLTIAGGMAKMTKLGQGLLDLHSRRGDVDLDWLSQGATDPAIARKIKDSNTALEAFGHAGPDLARYVAKAAYETAKNTLGDKTNLDIAIFDRMGKLLARREEVLF